MFRKDHGYKPCVFDIRKQLLDEVKYIMSFYKKFGLINNKCFTDVDYEKLDFGDVDLIFYLGGYVSNSKKFEKHLGVYGKNNDSVINLINNNPTEYKYIEKNQIFDFKFYKDVKLYNEDRVNTDLKVDTYSEVKVVRENNSIRFNIIEKI